MNIFDKLSPEEKSTLLKFPAYISLLAANYDGELDEKEKKAAIRFSHIKTYSCDPLLKEFYHEADKVFENNFSQLDIALPHDKIARDIVIKNELEKLEILLLKIGEPYIATMHRSMKSFKDHVSKSHRNVLEFFVFPMPIKGLNG